MNQQFQEEDYSDLDYNFEEEPSRNISKKKYTPLWAWIPFSVSVLMYMLTYIFLFDLSFDDDLSTLGMAAFFAVIGAGLEYLVRNKMNRDSKILKGLRWILVFIYCPLTLLDIADIFISTLTLSFTNVLGLAGVVGMSVALIYSIKENL